MCAPEIAFDEGGNTGQNLLDPEQPVFVTAGVLFSDDDVNEVRELLQWREGEELHFVKLRRSRQGSERIVTLINSRFAEPDHVKFMMILKRFMILTKIVDVLIEARAYEDGVDLYKDGAHLSMSNMFHYCMPTFCGADLYEELLRCFVEMMRTGKIRPIRTFYETVRQMIDNCTDEAFRPSLGPLLASADLIGDILELRSITDLDPAVPAFVCVAARWDAHVGGEWSVVHDESKPIAFDQDILECYMTGDEEPQQFREGDAAFHLPLRATGITFAASHDVPQLQLADIFASSVTHFWKGVADPARKDELWHLIEETTVLDAGVGGVWPTPSFTPSAVEMEGFDGRLAEFAGELIGRKMRERHGPNWLRERRKRR